MSRFAIAILFFTLGVIAANTLRQSPTQHMNDLIAVGFTMYDPEGHRVDTWDE